MHYGALEIITVIDSALKKLEERTLKDDLVMKSCSRNGFLEFRPVNPGAADMKLVCTADQPWRKKLPGPETSHRLRTGWTDRRWAHVDEKTGVPAPPLKDDMEAFKEEAKAVAAPEEVAVVKDEAGKVALKGPSEVVAGQQFEAPQCFPGKFLFKPYLDPFLREGSNWSRPFQHHIEKYTS